MLRRALQRKLFVEPDYERPPTYARSREARFLVAKCLLAHTLLPAQAKVVMDAREAERRADVLRAAGPA